MKKNSNASKVYVTEHLPKILYEQKKRLPHFTRRENRRTSWCIQDGEYCHYVEGKRVEAKLA